MGVLPVRVSVHHIHAWGPWRSEESITYPGTGITDFVVVVVVAMWCRESNLGSLQEHVYCNFLLKDLLYMQSQGVIGLYLGKVCWQPAVCQALG